MEYNVQKLADMGRFEDDQLAHVATGEMIVPPVISTNTRMMIQQDMLNQGMDPNQYIVGGNPSINPQTGLQEFFIKKLFKKIKKVVKKVAPIAVNFIPGVGPVAKAALTAAAGKASGLSTKEALLGGALSFAGGKMFGGAGGAGQGLGGSGRFSRIKSFFNPAEGTKGIFGGKIGPGIRRGLGSMFKPGQQIMPGQQPMMPEGDFTMVSGGQQDYEVNPLVADLYQKGEITYQEGFDGMPAFFTNAAGDKFYTPEDVEAAYSSQVTGNRIQQLQEGGIENFLSRKLLPQKIEDVLKGSGGFGNLLSRKLLPQAMEDRIQEGGIGNVFGQNTGLMGLAALYGLATKKAAEKTEGGLRDIRLSTRPDLMPQQVYQGFDTGVRPGMSYGGALGYRPGMSYGGPMDEDELDLRIGGPSIGPGTETSDDIPAMLSDGEFVMTAAANKGLGGFKIEKNKDSLTIFPTGQPDREQGFKNNDKLMKFFENYQDMMS